MAFKTHKYMGWSVFFALLAACLIDMKSNFGLIGCLTHFPATFFVLVRLHPFAFLGSRDVPFVSGGTVKGRVPPPWGTAAFFDEDVLIHSFVEGSYHQNEGDWSVATFPTKSAVGVLSPSLRSLK